MDALNLTVAPQLHARLPSLGVEVEVLCCHEGDRFFATFPCPVCREPFRPQLLHLRRQPDHQTVTARVVDLEELTMLPVQVWTTLKAPPDVGLRRPALRPVHARHHLHLGVVPHARQEPVNRVGRRKYIVTEEEDEVAVAVDSSLHQFVPGFSDALTHHRREFHRVRA